MLKNLHRLSSLNPSCENDNLEEQLSWLAADAKLNRNRKGREFYARAKLT